MNIQPTLEEAQRRLRIDDDADMLADLTLAIDGAHAEMLAFLDRSAIYEDKAALDVAIAAAQAAYDAETDEETALQLADDLARVSKGIVVKADLISAQLLLADALMASNTAEDAERKRNAARALMSPHRNMGV